MRIKFIGVGEAFDEDLSNTSIRVRKEGNAGKSSILLDCGFTAPPPFWKSCPHQDDLDAIWISHFHGDHFFGLPALLTRFQEMGRAKPLLILGQHPIDRVVPQIVELAYPSILSKFTYDIRFLTIEPGETVEAAGVTWRCALNGHCQKCLAVRIDSGGKSIFYSGDGPGTDESLDLPAAPIS